MLNISIILLDVFHEAFLDRFLNRVKFKPDNTDFLSTNNYMRINIATLVITFPILV